MVDEEETKKIGSWPPRNTKILVNVLANEVIRGNLNNGQFKQGSWTRITSSVVQQANHAYTVAQVQGKFNRLRAKHRKFSTLHRDPSGFGWNPETNTVTASEVAWQKHLDDYNLLGLIFNNSTATGGLAHGSSHDPSDTDVEEAAEELMDGGIHVDNGDGERTDINIDCYQPDSAVRRSISGNTGVVTR
ncbi:hypothetical protein CJ030_MR2G020392 [Morella rubra]|uniref:Myb/SANT-like domain-containing protein n=1 Tax=Morella rubra TaxID=262757 RepID=A0A6A1WEE8_9ROSI|nr:hypothetical protein CJ030_MR2G020392 [Morella rubra]